MERLVRGLNRLCWVLMGQESDLHTPAATLWLFWSVAVVLAALLGFAAVLVSAESSLTGRPVFDLLLLAALANFLFYIFVRTYPGWTVQLHVKLIGVMILLQVVGMCCLRMDGLYGNGRPKFVWRWAADREFAADSAQLFEFDPHEKGVWAGFRGSDRSGAIEGIELESWERFPPALVWEKQVGRGWSSFSVADTVCFTQEQRGDFEAIVCYDLATGRQQWEHLDKARFYDVTSGAGPRATPTIDGELVFSFGATGLLNCLVARNGDSVWARDVLKENGIENCNFGMVGSPLVTDGMVVVAPGGKNCSLIAYDRENGSQKWASGSEAASYSSPQAAVVCGTASVLCFNGDGLACHRLDDGKQLFQVPWISNAAEKNNVCQPIVVSDVGLETQIFISSGYGRGAALLRVSQQDDQYAVAVTWKNKLLKSKFSSVVAHNGYVYGLDNGILTCLSLTDGARMWKAGRYGHGQLIRVGSELIVISEKGFVAKVACDPNQFRELARLQALDDRTWNHPAFDGNYLLVRNDRSALCFRLAVSAPASVSVQ